MQFDTKNPTPRQANLELTFWCNIARRNRQRTKAVARLATLTEKCQRNANRFRIFHRQGATFAPTFFYTGNLFPNHMVSGRLTKV